MKGLAHFVMRGRLQALLIIVAGAGSLLFCWISAAALALVTLRKGAGYGASLFMWALLPAGTLLYVYGDSGPMTLLGGTMVLALVLRSTVSLSLSVLAGVGVGVVIGLVLVAFSAEYLSQMVAFFGEFLGSLEEQLSKEGQTVVLPRPEAGQIAGMLGAAAAMMSILCLLLARYWQAALYNPGGFGLEFRALQYSMPVSAGLAVAAIALWGLGEQYRSWAMICLLPLTFAGLALIHARVDALGQSRGWLTWFYIIWLLFDPVKFVLVLFVIADSWINFRQRWPKASGKELHKHDEYDRKDD